MRKPALSPTTLPRTFSDTCTQALAHIHTNTQAHRPSRSRTQALSDSNPAVQIPKLLLTQACWSTSPLPTLRRASPGAQPLPETGGGAAVEADNTAA